MLVSLRSYGVWRISGLFFFFQAEDGIRDIGVTGVQTCALPISLESRARQEARDAWESDPPLHRMPRAHRVRSAAHRHPNWTPLRQARNQWRFFLRGLVSLW